jgi:hypothetical protein
MPVVATPNANSSNSLILSRNQIRMMLRDYGAQSNILLDTVQFSDAELDQATNMAISEFNCMTPISGITNGNLPVSILLLGVCSWLMMSESFLQIRNQATVQDGDIAPIGIDDKNQIYFSLAQSIKADWKSTAKMYKTQLNMESAYGQLSSGYINVSRFHNS